MRNTPSFRMGCYLLFFHQEPENFREQIVHLRVELDTQDIAAILQALNGTGAVSCPGIDRQLGSRLFCPPVMEAGAPGSLPAQQAVEDRSGDYIHIVLDAIGILPGDSFVLMSLNSMEQIVADFLVVEQVNHHLVQRTFDTHFLHNVAQSVISVNQLTTKADTQKLLASGNCMMNHLKMVGPHLRTALDDKTVAQLQLLLRNSSIHRGQANSNATGLSNSLNIIIAQMVQIRGSCLFLIKENALGNNADYFFHKKNILSSFSVL